MRVEVVLKYAERLTGLKRKRDEIDKEIDEVAQKLVDASKNRSDRDEAPVSRYDQLVAILSGSPGMAIAELSLNIYGSDNRNSQNRTRSLLSLAKKKGLVEQMAELGKWQVVKKDGSEEGAPSAIEEDGEIPF